MSQELVEFNRMKINILSTMTEILVCLSSGQSTGHAESYLKNLIPLYKEHSARKTNANQFIEDYIKASTK